MAYAELVTSDRRLLLATLQSFAACEHTEVQEAVWRGFDEVYSYVQAVTRASPEEMHRFVANRLVILVGAAIDMPASDQPWARGLREACSLPRPQSLGKLVEAGTRRGFTSRPVARERDLLF